MELQATGNTNYLTLAIRLCDHCGQNHEVLLSYDGGNTYAGICALTKKKLVVTITLRALGTKGNTDTIQT